VFNHKQPQPARSDGVRHAELIDLLLDSDELTRRQLILQVLQTGAVRKSEAEELMAQVLRLKRVAGPRSPATTPVRAEQEPGAAWGIDYP
jgi:hypothetical protein